MRKYTKASSLICIILCLMALMSFMSMAAEVKLTDIEGHWAKEYITYGVEKGYINGYTDNTFKPDNTVTRAEFSKMINSALKITGMSPAEFKDVSSKDWYADVVKSAQYAGYIKGYEDKTFRPNNPITRQEAAVILSRIVLPTSKRADLNLFKDKDSIASWAQDAVAMIAYKGYMKGDQNNNATPTASLTRGQAAKLICEFVKAENVVNGKTEITKGQTISQTLFTDGIVVSCAEEAEIILEDCRVLGDIEIKKGPVVLSLGNTVCASVVNNSDEDAVVMADKDSSIAVLTVYHPMFVMGDNITKVVLDGEDLESGTVEFDGDFKEVDVNSDAIIKISGGEIAQLDVNKQVILVVQAGEIGKINALAGAKNSVITLAQKVSVDEVVNDAAVSYTGLGEIKKATNNEKGVTYETEPKTVTGKDAENTESGKTDEKEDEKKDEDKKEPGAGEVNEDFFTEFTISPANKKTGVAVTANIVLTFDAAVSDKNGDKPTEEYITDNIQIRKGSASGSKVTFTATVNSTKKITLNPKTDLLNDTKYYVIIPEGTLSYANGTINPKYSSYFTTGAGSEEEEGEEDEDKDALVTFSPKNKATGVAVDTKIVLTFSEKMFTGRAATITADYVEENVEIRKNSSTGLKVEFKATVASSYKKITLAPLEELDEGKKYYVIIPSGVFENEKGSTLTKQSVYFTTKGTSSSDDDDDDDESSSSDELTFEVSPEDGTKNISVFPEFILTFSEPVAKANGKTISDEYVEDDVVELRKSSKTGTKIMFTANVSSNKRKITITSDEELTPGTKYYLIVKSGTLLGTVSDDKNDAVAYTYTVASATTPSVYPANAAKSVPVDEKIILTFSDGLYTTASTSTREAVTADYIEENDIVTLRRKTTTGVIIDCDITVTKNTITLTPKDKLSPNYKYYVVVKGSKLYGEGKKAYSAITTYFDTNEQMIPEFTPEDGDEDVKVDAKLTISFGEAVETESGAKVTKSYLANEVVRLYRGDPKNGEEVEFTASISTDYTTITVEPDDVLEGNTEYTLVLVGGTLKNDNDEVNPAKNITFLTESKINKEVEFEPGDKEVNVPINTYPTVKFKTSVLDKNGKTVTDKYATSAILLCLGSKTTSKAVPAQVKAGSDGKTFTIIPDTPLDANGKKYYIWVQEGYFVYNDDDATPVKTSSAYFTTVKTMPEFTSIEKGDITEESVTFTFKTKSDGRVYFEFTSEYGTEETSVGCTKDKEKSYTIDGLMPGTTYKFEVYIVSAGVESEVKKFTITTDGEAPESDEEENEACTYCGSEEHATVDHPSCAWCGSKLHTTQEHPSCQYCGDNNHTSAQHPQCAECGSRDHTTDEHVDPVTPPDDGNDGTDGGNEGTDGGNEGTDGGNEGTDGGNEGTDGGNEGTDGGNEGTDGGNEGTDGGNTELQ